jgi:hypothetical protein
MALKVFQKFGLKRELNLADVPAKRNALNNLLDGLSDGITPFTWEDIQVIQNIYLSDVTTGTFTNASNATVLQIQPNGDLKPYSPLITLENRFDKAYFTTSEPFFAGGDGLSATYYDNDGIVRATEGDAASDFIELDDVYITDEDDFWERGYFEWANKVNLKNRSLYGAIRYEGYFKPSTDGVHSLRLLDSRGFFRIEFDDKTEVRDFEYDPLTNTFNYKNYNFTSNVETGLTGGLDTLIDQTKLDQSTNLATAVIDGTSSGLNSARTVTVNLGSLVQWDAYKIRITWFIDEAAINAGANITKRYNVQILQPNNSWRDLNYKKLFTKNYFRNYDIGDFRSFVENSISLGGTRVGSQGTIGDISGTFTPLGVAQSIGDSYANVNNFNPIVSYYTPPNTIADVEEVVSGCTYTAGGTTVSVSNALPNSTEFIEVGNFVKGSGITPGTRVTKVVINSSIEISPTPTANGTGLDLTFVDHRGLVAFGDNGLVATDGIGGVGSDYGVDDILPNSILLCSRFSTDFGGATFDDQTTDPTTFGVSIEGKIVDYYDSSIGVIFTKPNPVLAGSFPNEKYYVYQSAGLIDDGLKFFCQGVFKARLLATQIDTSSTSVVLTLDSEQIQNVSLNDWVHAFPAVNFGQRPDGSVQELFSKVQVTGIDLLNNQITITNTVDGGAALLTALEYIPAKVKNIVFTPTDVNREVCFKPTDTSPPFAANATGLITSNGVAAVDDFTSAGGGNININSTVAYNDLEIVYEYPGDPNAATKLASNIIVYNNENISAYLPVEDDAGNTFYMMLGN